MSYEEALTMVTMIANGDLSGSQYLGVVNGVGGAVVAGAGVPISGILQDKPEDGQAAAVAISGISKGVAGGTVAQGADVATDADGKFITAAGAGTVIVGEAQAGGVADDIIPILLNTKGTLVA